MSGCSTLVYVGDQLYIRSPFEHHIASRSSSHSSRLNISYKMTFATPGFRIGGDMFSSHEVTISAEGTYGCHHLGSKAQNLVKNETLDWDYDLSFNFLIKRKWCQKCQRNNWKYKKKVRPNSNALSCLLILWTQVKLQQPVGGWTLKLQWFSFLIHLHVYLLSRNFFMRKGNQMCFHSFPFWCLWFFQLGIWFIYCWTLQQCLLKTIAKRKFFFLESHGWLGANEVIITVVTMVAFIVKLYLLQLTWSSR